MRPFSSLLIMMLIVLCGCSTKKVPPNIVFIFIDDMGWKDVGFMGATYYETPNIDRLANGGMTFTQAYANAANCAPTRACLLTGQYSPRHGVFTVGKSDRGSSKDRRIIPIENSTKVSLDKVTIAEALKPAGYVSAAIGKWHIGNSPQEQGFDIGIDRGDMDYPYGHFNPDSTYLTDHLSEVASNFIRNNNPKETGRPFFLYLSHHAVHTPIQAKQEKIRKYEGEEGQGCHNNAKYAAMVESVDESVVLVNQTLEELGLSDNTLIIFFSDNGGHGTYTCQRPLRGGKGMYFEGGIREPMFAYWPGTIEPGSTNENPVISTDFYPTFVELAGAALPENHVLDGESLASTMMEGERIDRSIFWHFPAYLQSYEGLREDSRDPIFRTRPVSVIRKGDWKLLLFHEEWVLDGGIDSLSSNHAVELYNLAKDISESNNLVNKEIQKRDELLDELLAWMEQIKAPVPLEANEEYGK